MSELTIAQRQSLEEFRDFKISLEGLRNLQQGRLSFDFVPSGSYMRSLQKNADPAEPGVPIRREHLAYAYKKWKAAEVDAKQLADWVNMIVMNDDYDIDECDEDLIADWLNSVAVDGVIKDPFHRD